jgi:hypothetical protein
MERRVRGAFHRPRAPFVSAIDHDFWRQASETNRIGSMEGSATIVGDAADAAADPGDRENADTGRARLG